MTTLDESQRQLPSPPGSAAGLSRPGAPLWAAIACIHRHPEEPFGRSRLPYCGTLYASPASAPRVTLTPARKRRPRRAKHSSQDIVYSGMKILVVAPSWIGDTILAQPLLALLKRNNPAARIEVLAPDWSAPLLARMPRWMRSSSILSLTASSISATPRAGSALEGHAAGAVFHKLTCCRTHGSRRWFRSSPVLRGASAIRAKALPAAERAPPARCRRTRNWCSVTPRWQDAARHPAAAATELHGRQQQAARLALKLPLDAAPVIFCPGAEYGRKRWPAQNFATLARLIATPQNPVWLVGSGRTPPSAMR